MRPVLLLLLALLAWPSMACAADWSPSDDDALLFELRSGTIRLGDGVRGYSRVDDQCVVLADLVLALDLPIRVDRTSGRASGWVFAEDETLSVDSRANTVELAGRRRALPPGAVSDVPEGWCVGTAELGRWLDVTLRPDLANASLHIEASRKLPFELAAERRARAASLHPARTIDLATLPQAATPYRAWRTPAVDVVASAGVTRLADTPMRRDVRYEIFASGEVAGVSVDARLASNGRGVPDRLRARAYRADPSRGLSLGATLIEAGDVSAVSSPLVAGGAQGRGVAITSRPLTQPDTFSTTNLVGDLPAGWEAELYRNEELIAFAQPRTDGRYEFRAVPLRFGANALTVVLYGPQGQVRRQTQRVRVGEESIPPERTWYWMSANDAGRDLVALRSVPRGTSHGWRGSLGLEHGLTKRTSVFAYAHTLRSNRERRTTVEGGVRQSFGVALAQVTGAWQPGGGWAGQLQVLGGSDRTAVALSAFTSSDFVSDRVDRALRHEVSATVDTSVGKGGGAVPVHAGLRWRVDESGQQRLGAELRASVAIRQFYLTGDIEWNRNRLPGLGLVGPGVDAIGLGVDAIGPRAVRAPVRAQALTVDGLSAALLASGAIGRVRVRGGARFIVGPETRLDRLDASAEWAAGERGRLRATVSYSPVGKRGLLAVGTSRQFDRFALGGRLEAATDGSVAAGIDVQFSLAPRRGGVRLSSQRLASTGRAEVRVFRDINGDGVRQPDEPVERDVQLMVGTAAVPALTDARGIAVVDGLVPNVPVLLGVDASSLPDPLILPVGPGKVVVPRPGVAAIIDLALSGAGVVEGTLATAVGGTLGGVDLELVDAGGVVVATTRSEFDGYFAFERAPYGRASLRVNRLAAAAITVRPETGRTVVLSDTDPIALLGTVVPDPLGPKAMASASP